MTRVDKVSESSGRECDAIERTDADGKCFCLHDPEVNSGNKCSCC